jgi:hypothetical protein
MAIRFSGQDAVKSVVAPTPKPKKSAKKNPTKKSDLSKDVVIRTRLPREMRDRFASTCDANGVSVSEKLRELMEEYVDVYAVD